MGDRFDETALYIIFDGPPGHESGRFVEVEDWSGASVHSGAEWRERGNGLYSLGPLYNAAALRAEHERGQWEERARYRYALSYAESNLTCGDDASENGHGGMWCFTRAALDKDGDPCECTNCRAWREVCGVIDSAKAGLDAREGDHGE